MNIVGQNKTHNKRVKNDAQKARAFYPGRYECPKLRHSCRSLVVRVGQELAVLRSTLTNHMSMPGVWRMSVVAPNSEVHEILI